MEFKKQGKSLWMTNYLVLIGGGHLSKWLQRSKFGNVGEGEDICAQTRDQG